MDMNSNLWSYYVLKNLVWQLVTQVHTLFLTFNNHILGMTDGMILIAQFFLLHPWKAINSEDSMTTYNMAPHLWPGVHFTNLCFPRQNIINVKNSGNFFSPLLLNGCLTSYCVRDLKISIVTVKFLCQKFRMPNSVCDAMTYISWLANKNAI